MTDGDPTHYMLMSTGGLESLGNAGVEWISAVTLLVNSNEISL